MLTTTSCCLPQVHGVLVGERMWSSGVPIDNIAHTMVNTYDLLLQWAGPSAAVGNNVGGDVGPLPFPVVAVSQAGGAPPQTSNPSQDYLPPPRLHP